MPIIPTGREQVRTTVSSPVPIGSADFAGTAGRGLAAIGQGIQNLGEAAQRQEQQLEQQQNRVSIMEGQNDLQNVYKKANDIAMRTARPDGSDLVEKFKEAYQPEHDAIVGRYAGNEEVGREMTSFASRLNSDADVNLFVAKNQMLEKSNYDRMETVVNQAGDRTREKPSEAMVSAETKTFNAQLDMMAGTMRPENIQKMKDVFYQQQAQQYITGLGEKGQFGKALNALRANQEDPSLMTKMDPDQAQKLGFITKQEADQLRDSGGSYDVPVLTKGSKVTLTPELSQVMSKMDPKEKARFIDHFQAKAKEATELKLSDINAQVDGYERMSMAGKLPVGADKQKADLLASINNTPQLSLPAKMRLMDKLNSAQAVNSQIALASQIPRSQWGQLADTLDAKFALGNQDAVARDPRLKAMDSDLAVQGNRLAQKDRFMLGLQRIDAERKEDPAGFRVQSDATLATAYQGTKDGDPQWSQKYAAQMLASQRFLQMPSAILPKQDAQRTAAILKSAPDSDTAGLVLSKLQNQWGPYFPQAMQDIAKTDKDLSAFSVAVYAPETTRASLIDAIKNRKTINDTVTARPLWKEDQMLMKTQMSTLMADFDSTVAASTNDSQRLEVSETFRDAMDLQAKREIARGMQPQYAVAKAYKDLIESQYAIEAGGRNSSRVLVPKYLPDEKGRQVEWDTSLAKSFVDSHSDRESFKELGVAVPKTASTADNYYETLESNHRWVTNRTQSGMQLMLVQDGKLQPVYTKYGKTVEKPYQDLAHDPGERVMNQRRSYLGRMFGG